MNNLLDQNDIHFKINDKVRVLSNASPDNKSLVWKTSWYGVIVELGTHFARVWDFQKTDSNIGTVQDSSEWIPYSSKMLKIIKD